MENDLQDFLPGSSIFGTLKIKTEKPYEA